jgi:hypothetical protein
MNETEFKKGDRVKHNLWGTGTFVKHVIDSGLSVIKFDTVPPGRHDPTTVFTTDIE